MWLYSRTFAKWPANKETLGQKRQESNERKTCQQQLAWDIYIGFPRKCVNVHSVRTMSLTNLLKYCNDLCCFAEGLAKVLVCWLHGLGCGCCRYFNSAYSDWYKWNGWMQSKKILDKITKTHWPWLLVCIVTGQRHLPFRHLAPTPQHCLNSQIWCSRIRIEFILVLLRDVPQPRRSQKR